MPYLCPRDAIHAVTRKLISPCDAMIHHYVAQRPRRYQSRYSVRSANAAIPFSSGRAAISFIRSA